MKTYYTKTNRKKIRGWKRRVKKLDKWGEHIKRPAITPFENYGYTYYRCTLSPFYSLIKQSPPIWFYKLIVAKFVIAYTEWQKTFDALDVPYDLMLWIHDPSFPHSEIIRSEIISYKVDKKGDKATLGWQSDRKAEFPYKLLSDPAYRLEDFDWMLTDEEYVLFKDDIEEEEINIEALITDGYVKKTHNNGTVYYAKHRGNMWVGRKR